MLYVVCLYRFDLVILFIISPVTITFNFILVDIIYCYYLPVQSVAGPLSPFSGFLPLGSAVTPLHVDQFALELKNHPNQPQVSFVLGGLSKGFRVGYNFPLKLKSAPRNKPSAYAHPDIVDAYLANEVSLGRVAGPFDRPPLPGLHISSFGVIPKKGQPGKWRLIVDLSSPYQGRALMMGSPWNTFT